MARFRIPTCQHHYRKLRPQTEKNARDSRESRCPAWRAHGPRHAVSRHIKGDVEAGFGFVIGTRIGTVPAASHDEFAGDRVVHPEDLRSPLRPTSPTSRVAQKKTARIRCAGRDRYTSTLSIGRRKSLLLRPGRRRSKHRTSLLATVRSGVECRSELRPVRDTESTSGMTGDQSRMSCRQVHEALRAVGRGPRKLERSVISAKFDGPIRIHQRGAQAGAATGSPRSTRCANAMAWRSAQRPSYPLGSARKAQWPPCAVSR